jgi:hypothetical protein
VENFYTHSYSDTANPGKGKLFLQKKSTGMTVIYLIFMRVSSTLVRSMLPNDNKDIVLFLSYLLSFGLRRGN